MQWLFDIVLEMVANAGFIKIADVELYLKGMIVMWSGGLGDIPAGWALCNGTQGTPNLKNKFVYSSGPFSDPHSTGGSVAHNHNFTGDGHDHNIVGGVGISTGSGASVITSTDPAVGTTDGGTSLPPYYALAYIMKL